MFGIVFIIAAVAVVGGIIVAGVGAVKTSNNKAEEHSARMAEYANKSDEHDARMDDFSRKAEEHEWKRADRDSSLREKEIEMKLNEVRLQKEMLSKSKKY